MQQTKANATDRLVNEITAFRSWNDMLASLKSGYVPTISHTRSGEKLARIVEAAGFRVYMPRSGLATRK